MKIPQLSKLNLYIVGAVLLLAVLVSGFFYYQYRNIKQQLQNPADFAKEQTQAIINRVAKLMELPVDEIPVVYTISDTEKLKNQPFFARAKNGDQVLIYTNAKKAIIYDPIANKIIDVAPINISSPSADITSPSSTVSSSLIPTMQSFKFFLLNGTSKVGLTQKYEGVLKKAIPNAIVVDRDNAKKNDYTKSILVDISGTKGKEAEQISQLLDIPIEKLPADEEKPINADFLIILGGDK